MDRPFFYCASLPRERGVTVDAPHLVAPVYLEDLHVALRTMTGLLLDGGHRGHIVGVTDVRLVCAGSLGFMAMGTCVLVAHTALPLTGHITTTSVVDTRVDRYRSCVFWFSNWIPGLFGAEGASVSQSHINKVYATFTLIDDTFAFLG